jgi:predicted nucleic acid-binding protein
VSLVIDSSAILAWVHGDERTPEIEAVFDRVVEEGAIVPHLWHLEVANSLTIAVRRKRVSQAFRDEVLKDLEELDISVASDTAANAWGASVRLCRSLWPHRL